MSKVHKLECVAEYELPVAVDSKPMCYRVEVFSQRGCHQESGQYFVRVFRYDLFRVLPTFSSAGGMNVEETADHDILVLDPMFGTMNIIAESSEVALDLVIQKIRDQLILP